MLKRLKHSFRLCLIGLLAEISGYAILLMIDWRIAGGVFLLHLAKMFQKHAQQLLRADTDFDRAMSELTKLKGLLVRLRTAPAPDQKTGSHRVH